MGQLFRNDEGGEKLMKYMSLLRFQEHELLLSLPYFESIINFRFILFLCVASFFLSTSTGPSQQTSLSLYQWAHTQCINALGHEGNFDINAACGSRGV